MAIPTRILEEINHSEVNAERFYSTYGKENIEAGLADLNKSNMEILNTYSVQSMRAAVEKKLGKENKNILKFPAYKIVAYAAAAVLLAAIVIPAGLKNSSITAGKAPVERVKGTAPAASDENPKLNLYRKNGLEVQSLKDGDFAHSGDVIQITYNAGRGEYGVIFSVDGNGNITRHFPENSWTSEQLIHKNEEIPLDFSYELDNAPDFECFILVTSKKQFNLSDLEEKIQNKTDIDYISELSYLPKKTEGTIFVLEK